MERDYDLLGESGKRAVETGLATAQWYHTDIPRKEMKALMQRSDGPATRDSVIYYGLAFASAAMGIALWPSWWSVPFWLIYGLLYASGADSRWHECGHGTAFKTPWKNRVVYQIACFCLLRNPILWRWSHVRHHTDTIIVGRDPEIITMRPPDIFKVLVLFLGWDTIRNVGATVRHAFFGLTPTEKSYTPETDWANAQSVARIWLLILLSTLLAAMAFGSILPFMIILGPVVFGSWHYIITGLLQHTGLADNVIDHRLNSRTVYMNRFSRFIYWNMNYHVEHHMFPMVPYHSLPQLHERMKIDTPAANPGILHGLREVFSALIKQLDDPEYRVERPLPSTAKPYRLDLHETALGHPAA